MKRLSINDIAKASLRTGKRAYLSLAIGIFLSIFLVTVLALSMQGVYLSVLDKRQRVTGAMDFMTLDDTDHTDSDYEACGMFDSIGHAYVLAQIDESGWYVGKYDETGKAMLRRSLSEGCMPEQPGEIAAERSVLENLRIEAQIGDAIELTLIPQDGLPETRTYILTGILNEQSVHMDASENMSVPGHIMSFPAMLVHEDEPAFTTGRTAVHRLVTLRRGVTMKKAFLYWQEKVMSTVRMDINGELLFWYEDLNVNLDLHTRTIMIALLGMALLIASGVGISQSMDAQLARRREEIGMLRAVGATKRQIRRIFGREAWLLALILSPAAVGAGCALAFAISRFIPDTYIFRAEPELLAPILLFSAACILISASLPLRRASGMMPMSVIRDTQLLRRAKRIRPKKRFSASRLIAARQMMLYPTRQIGASLLIALMVFFAGGVTQVSGESYMQNIIDRSGAFELGVNGSWPSYDFVASVPVGTLSEQDIAQIRSLDHVEGVRVFRETSAMLLIEKEQITEHFLEMANSAWQGTAHLTAVQNPDGSWPNPYAEAAAMEYARLRELHPFEGEAANMALSVVTLTQADVERIAVADGRIDLDAVNSGREVLVYAPDFYYHPDGGVGTTRSSENDTFLPNDSFYAGQPLSLIQLTAPEAELEASEGDLTNAERHDAKTVVGAVLGSDSDLYKTIGIGTPGLITTPEGAHALGLYPGSVDSASIYLDSVVDEETEKALEERISVIAMRGDNLSVNNNLERLRADMQDQQMMLITYASIAIVFFAVAVSMIAGGVGRRIRAERRTIGLLRAVGADARMLMQSYSGQIMMSIALGSLLGMAAFAPTIIAGSRSAVGAVLIMISLAGASLVCCMMSLRRNVGDIIRKTIVENIREL